MTPSELLEQTFVRTFTQVKDLLTLRQFHHNNAFCLDEQGNITAISACGNNFPRITIPAAFIHLQYLNLSDNSQLQQLTFEQPPSQLVHLDVSDSQLSSFRLPAGCHQLQWLDLSRNQIREFIPDGPAPRLQYLDLSGNQLERFDAAWLDHFTALRGLYLQKNALSEQKTVFTDRDTNCLEAMQQFREDLRVGRATNKEYKVLVVGDGHVGKTCLVAALTGDPVNEQHHSTQGIALKAYHHESYRFNIWDFGGQDIYYATHRLFMQQQALYLALWDQYSQEHETTPIREHDRVVHYRNYKLPYWLHYIKVFGENSKALAIKTKAAKHYQEHPQRQLLKERYRDLDLRFLQLDSVEQDQADHDFDDLRKAMLRIVGQFMKDAELPESWDRLRRHMREQLAAGKRSLSLDNFYTLATEVGIGDREHARQLLTWLVQTGVVFYRKNYFQDQILLDQNWAIDAVYLLFDRRPDGGYDRIKREQYEQLYFTGAVLTEIWQHKYPHYRTKEIELLVEFILSCAICFELPYEQSQWPTLNERRFVAPQLLSAEPPRLLKKIRSYMDDPAFLRYRHALLHYGTIQQFIVRTAHLAQLEEIWQNGTVIEDPEGDATAIVAAHNHEATNRQDILIQLPRSAHSLLHGIRELFDELQRDLEVTEELSPDGHYFVSIEKLQRHQGEYIDLTADDGATRSVPVAELQFFLGKDPVAGFHTLDKPDGKKRLDRDPLPKTTKDAASVRQLIAKDELLQAAALCLELSIDKDKDLHNRAVTIQGQITSLAKEKQHGTLSADNIFLQENKIRRALAVLADELG